ncbi:MAG: NAD-binding protein, partial [Planctomycetota bacterium]
ADYQFRLTQLCRLALWITLTWIVGANLVHFTETRLVGDQGPFAGYWQAYWNILIVLVSGMEDKEPLSVLGRIEVTFILLAGICAVGMFTAQLVSSIVRMSQRVGKIAVRPPRADFQHHILILGANEHLHEILGQLHHALKNRHHILVVHPGAEDLAVTDPEVYRNVFAWSADPLQPNVLDQVGLDRASRVIILSTGDAALPKDVRDSRTLMVTLAVVHKNPRVPTVAEIHTPEGLSQAEALKSAEFVLSRRYGSRMIARAALRPGLAEVYRHLLEFSDESCEFYCISVPPELVGGTFKEARLHFLDRDDEAICVVGLTDRTNGDRRFLLCPTTDPGSGSRILDEKDELVVTAYRNPELLDSEREGLWSGQVLLRL